MASAYERTRARTPGRKMQGSVHWRRASRTFLAEPGNDRCVYCGAPSECVDHHKPHKGSWELFWRRSNWRPCCLSCNTRKAIAEEGGFGKQPQPQRFRPIIRGCDSDGNPTDVNHPWNRGR